MEEQKEKFNGKRSLITIAIVLVTAAAVGGTTWWFANQGFNTVSTPENNENCQDETTSRIVQIGEASTSEYRNNKYGFTFTPGPNWAEVSQSIKQDKAGYNSDSEGTRYTMTYGAEALGGISFAVVETDKRMFLFDFPKGDTIEYNIVVENKKAVVKSERVVKGIPDLRLEWQWSIYGTFKYKNNSYTIITNGGLSKSQAKKLSDATKKVIESITFDN